MNCTRIFAKARALLGQRIQNAVASDDLVVALFPAAFEHFAKASADLGSAGHTGFARRDPPVYQLRFIKGKHGAALVPENFSAMASFVLGDDLAQPPSSLVIDRQSPRAVWIGKFCLPIFIGLVALALWPLWLPLLREFGFTRAPHVSIEVAVAWFVALFLIVRLA